MLNTNEVYELVLRRDHMVIARWQLQQVNDEYARIDAAILGTGNGPLLAAVLMACAVDLLPADQKVKLLSLLQWVVETFAQETDSDEPF